MDWTLIILGVGAVAVIAIIIKVVSENRHPKEQPLPYRAKKYFFSRPEEEFLHLMNESIDRHKFTVFPKVRLADFIEVTDKGPSSEAWWNKIKSKHVDFLVWDVLENKIVLAIELDDRSHQNEETIASDQYKDRIYECIGITLIRIDVGTSLIQKVGEIQSLLRESTQTKPDPTVVL